MRDWIRSWGFGTSLLVALSSGVIQALGSPPDGWLLGHFLGLVPLLLVLDRPGLPARSAFWLGLAGGLGIGLVGFPWIAEMLVRFARVPGWVGGLGLLAFSFWQAIPYGLFGLGLGHGPRGGWLGRLWPAFLFVALQSIWPNLFPYTALLGLAERPEFLQLAEVGGVPLVEWAFVFLATLIARGVMAQGWVAGGRDLLGAALIPPLLFVYGTVRIESVAAELKDAPRIQIGVIQPNIPIARIATAERMERLTGPSAQAAAAGAEMIVWPEAGAYPYQVGRPHRQDARVGGGRVLGRHQLPTLFGAPSRAAGERFGYNSAYLLEPNGAVKGEYDKVHLVPFGESIPLIDPDWVTDWIPQISHHYAGDGPARFVVDLKNSEIQQVAVGPLICYEDILPGYVREVAEQSGGIELFANLTIDAWYGDSAEPWEHLALAQIRSIEHRIPMVRSVSTGVSAFIDPTGRLVDSIPLRPVGPESLNEFPAEWLMAEVPILWNTAESPTPYARFGWLWGPLCWVISAGVVIRSGFLRRSSDASKDPSAH